jgi:hypothetical protein
MIERITPPRPVSGCDPFNPLSPCFLQAAPDRDGLLEAPKPDDEILDFWNIGDEDIPFEADEDIPFLPEEDLVPTSSLPPPAAPPINTLPPPAAHNTPRAPQSLD